MKSLMKNISNNLENSKIIEKLLYEKRRKVLSYKFINSKKYNKKIQLFYSKKDGKNSAELKTLNFNYRHKILNRTFGSWRWLGIYENKKLISKYVFSKKLKGIDFGGARGPISLEIEICDHLEKDVFGRKIKYNSIEEVKNNSLDFIWSSHTLEHIKDLEKEIKKFHKKLKKKGKIILNIPSYTCKRWIPGIHKYTDSKGDSSHISIFYLDKDKSITDKKQNYIPIDKLIGKYFKVEKAKYTGDNSIFIFAVK